MIIFDENVEDYWVQLIKNKGYSYLSIGEFYSGIADREIIDIVKKHKGLLVTEDKDFGELVFSHGINGLSILFMRYDQPDFPQIEESVLKCVESYFSSGENSFITITKNKIRIRKI